jgi:hypothetical protein
MPAHSHIDHIVIGAKTLAQGAAFIKQMLGVVIPPGGVHTTMGTHNLLMPLSDSVFLEVIAINPDLPGPLQPRWYGLDDPEVQARLDIQPCLLTWVINTDDIYGLIQNIAMSFGLPQKIHRGELSWTFGLPRDGRLLASGFVPYLIEWETARHPASAMPTTGCTLEGLTLYHAYPDWLNTVLKSVGAAHLVTVKPLGNRTRAGMTVKIRTPYGIKELQSLAPL